jgi:hypothetical protein
VRADYITDEMLEFLDELRESGKTSVFNRRIYLLEKFPQLSLQRALNVIAYWLQTFGEEKR